MNTTTVPALGLTDRLVKVYIAATAATIVALVVLSAIGSDLATSNAWGHAIVVAAFAVLLPLRLRAAHRGSRSAVRAVGVIAAVLLVVNLVEAVIPNCLPGWMRVEMLAVAALMAAVIVSVRRAAR